MMEDNGSFLKHLELNAPHGKARPNESQRRKFLAYKQGLEANQLSQRQVDCWIACGDFDMRMNPHGNVMSS